MSQRYLKLRYLQCRVLLVAAVVCLITLGVIWFSGGMKDVENPWLKWPFYGAVLLFIFVVYDLAMPTQEIIMAIKKHRFLTSTEQKGIEKEFNSGVVGFIFGFIAFLIVIYKLISYAI